MRASQPKGQSCSVWADKSGVGSYLREDPVPYFPRLGNRVAAQKLLAGRPGGRRGLGGATLMRIPPPWPAQAQLSTHITLPPITAATGSVVTQALRMPPTVRQAMFPVAEPMPKMPPTDT